MNYIFVNENILPTKEYGKYHKPISLFVDQFFKRLASFSYKHSYPAAQNGFITYEDDSVEILINTSKLNHTPFIKTSLIPHPFIIRLVPNPPSPDLGLYINYNNTHYIILFVDDDIEYFAHGDYVDILKKEYGYTLAHELTHMLNEITIQKDDLKAKEISIFDQNEKNKDKNYYFSYQEIFARIHEALIYMENRIINSVNSKIEKKWPLKKILNSTINAQLNENNFKEKIKYYLITASDNLDDQPFIDYINKITKEQFPHFKSRILKQIKNLYSLHKKEQ